jgi:hypothetical protein
MAKQKTPESVRFLGFLNEASPEVNTAVLDIMGSGGGDASHVAAFFDDAPLDVAEAVLDIVKAKVAARRKPGDAGAPKAQRATRRRRTVGAPPSVAPKSDAPVISFDPIQYIDNGGSAQAMMP